MKRPLSLLAGSLFMALAPPGILCAQDDRKKEKMDEISSRDEANFSIDKLVGGREVWAQTADQIEKDYQKGNFKWLETGRKDRGILRPKWMWLKSGSKNSKGSISAERTSYKLFGGASSAEEVNFEFRNGTLAGITMSIWNKGDSDEILRPDFMSKVTTLTNLLNDRFGVRVKDLGRDQASASKAMRLRWDGAETMGQLEYSFTEELVGSGAKRQRVFNPEFIRLRLMPKGEPAVGTTYAENAAKVSASTLVSRVKKLANGDVYIDGLPMVDQGEKGYCAVASSERVMRYYGIQCDQHDLAQAADASALGTSPLDLEEALHKLQGKFKIRVRDLVKFDYQDSLRLIRAYNKEAGKVQAKIWREDQMFFEPDVDIFREARCRNNASEKFQRMVMESTGRGMPLLWALRLGLYPENGEKARQSGGGHMRTIIGYNLKSDEIIFSDSWGAGHEMKRIKGRDAWAATLGLYLVEPQDAVPGAGGEAGLPSQTDAKVTARLPGAKEVAVEKAQVSRDRQEVIKKAMPVPAGAVSSISSAAAKLAGFNDAKIDKREWRRPAPPKDLKVTTVDFPLQVEAPHFFIAATPKVRPELIDIYAESAERLWAQMAGHVPALTEMFKDKRMALWLIEDREANMKFGSWVGKNMAAGSSYTWDRSTICFLNFPDKYAEEQKFLPSGRTFRMDIKGNMRDLKWPERIHFIAGDIFRAYLDPVRDNDEFSLSLLELGFAYYLEGEICGNITTEVSFGGGGANVEGFRNGRAWPATIKNLLKNPAVKPGIEKILRTEVTKAQPLMVGMTYALLHWSLHDPARSRAFNELLATAIKETKAPNPPAFARAYGFDSVDSFDAALVDYMKSDQFK